MAPLSYKKAVAAGLLKDIDKERLACVFLAAVDQVKLTGVWDQVAVELGLSRRSVDTIIPALLKKLRDGGCYADGSGDAAAPVKPKAKGRKRKAAEAEDSGVDVENAPKKAKGGKKDAMTEVKLEEGLEEGGNDEF